VYREPLHEIVLTAKRSILPSYLNVGERDARASIKGLRHNFCKKVVPRHSGDDFFGWWAYNGKNS
jgi:hypothetical protein